MLPLHTGWFPQEPGAHVPLAVPPLLDPSILFPHPRGLRQAASQGLPLLPLHPQVPTTSGGKQLGLAERTIHHDT